jgi:hypothetical protein
VTSRRSSTGSRRRWRPPPEVLQWSQNEVLDQIGVNQPELRDRAVAVGEKLGVFRTYPTAKNCVPPFAPVWSAEMVARQP